MRASKSVSIRVGEALAQRVEKLRGEFPASKGLNSLAEAMLEEMVALLETPSGERLAPGLLVQIDAIRESRRHRQTLTGAMNARGVAVAADAARDAVRDQPKRKR